jgi:2-polyprenyl-3-methyl-5-hydroxy-6-metoxy-1,4-benzoquinol methylase
MKNIMESQASEAFKLDKIRQQFDHTPYPRTPLDSSPKEEYNNLFLHNLVTSHYLQHRKVIETKDKLILDAGCGSGYKSLVLAEANPGAKIIGIDLSEESVKLARQRLHYHGFEATEFHALGIEELPKLGLEFDYINCDEVLYLLPDPVAGLKAMKSVLKPDGLIRTNLHNAYQRAPFYRAQQLFKLMGLMDNNPTEFEEEAVIETMQALKDQVRLKVESWGKSYREAKEPDHLKELLYSNQLLIGDKGFTVTDLFTMLVEADLEFLSMVDWRHWEVADLFQTPDSLPALWEMSLAGASVKDKLLVYELLNPIHRLMDFWCTHPKQTRAESVDEWEDADWQTAIVHLHPQLRTERAKAELIHCIEAAKPFEISREIPMPAQAPVMLEASTAACLLPLWDNSQPIQILVERYHQIHPIHPATLQPIPQIMAFEQVKTLLNRLDAFLYVLLERSR